MLSRSIALAGALLLSLSGSAIAQDDYDYDYDYDDEDASEYARKGAYVALSGVAALEDFKDQGSVDDSLGLDLRAGVRLHPHFATELAFQWIEGFDVSNGGNLNEIEIWTLTGNVKAYLLTGQVQPFAMLGMGVMESEKELIGGLVREDTVFVARLGGGLDFYASKNVVLVLEASYVLPAPSIEELKYLSLSWGFQYRF